MPQLMAPPRPRFCRHRARQGQSLTIALARITFPYVSPHLPVLPSSPASSTASTASPPPPPPPSLFNGVSIAAMLLLTPYVPTIGHSLAWGVTALRHPPARSPRLGRPPLRHVASTSPAPASPPACAILLRRMGPGLVGAGVTQLNLAVDVIIVTLLPPGSASLLYYADRVNQLPLGVIGTAVGTAILPLLSRQARSRRARDEARATLNRAIEITLVLTFPAALALAVAGQPIMQVLFARGAFDAISAAPTRRSIPRRLRSSASQPSSFSRSWSPPSSPMATLGTPVRVGIRSPSRSTWRSTWPLHGPPRNTSARRSPPVISALFNIITLAILLSPPRATWSLDARLRRRLPRMAAGRRRDGASSSIFRSPPHHGPLRRHSLALRSRSPSSSALGLATYAHRLPNSSAHSTSGNSSRMTCGSRRFPPAFQGGAGGG